MNRRDFLKGALTIAALAPISKLAAQTGMNGTRKSAMVYRKLGRTGLDVSAIALGIEGFKSKTPAETKSLVDCAYDNGVNFVDICIADPQMLRDMKNAIGNRRKDFIIQGHIGTTWERGQYNRSRNLAACKEAFETMLAAFGGVIEVAMIHYIDAVNDYERVFNGELIAYAKELKAAGKIKHIGLSSHSVDIAKRAVEADAIDVLMFSINLGYDLRPSGKRITFDESRQSLYELCARKNIGIDVMKAYGGGDLLNEQISPFGKAFSPVQALNYALTRPAVAAVMVGCTSAKQLKSAVGWCTASPMAKDYARTLAGLDAKSWEGHCLYCGHCAPCPREIDIANVNKYLNLAKAQKEIPATVDDHYKRLSHHASECIQCGACEKRCPFGVSVRKKMKEAEDIFGI